MSVEIIRKNPVKNPIEKIVLELSPEQAVVLYCIYRKIDGDRETSFRKHSEKISDELQEVFNFTEVQASFLDSLGSGAIHMEKFEDFGTYRFNEFIKSL